MNFTLLDYQEEAVDHLDQQLAKAYRLYHGEDNLRSTVALSSPPGSGKTVIMSAVLEHLFRGGDDIDPDPGACVLWITDNPALNKQTYNRFLQASDVLGADVPIRIIDSAWEEEKFAPGTVYFIHRQLLGKNKILSVRSDKRQYSFYDTVGNTIDDPDLTLYMMIDEAHRGIGSAAVNDKKANKTIYQTLINGYDGEQHAMPVVVGISATPKAFKDAMKQCTDERYQLKDADVDPARVQEGGLLKDSIRLVAPGERGNFQSGYIRKACQDLKDMTTHWNAYCDQQGIRRFKPAMLFQVEDKVKDTTLMWMCDIIKEELGDMVASPYSMVNAFGEHRDLEIGAYKLPYKEPEDISDDPDVVVIFAKTAISNGWDCPRAEVIISSRSSKSETDIEQILGRVIRTPLARTIDSDQLLNEVACYLPFYDTDTLQRIAVKLVSSYNGAIDEREIIMSGFTPDEEDAEAHPQISLFEDDLFADIVDEALEEKPAPKPEPSDTKPSRPHIPLVDNISLEDDEDENIEENGTTPKQDESPIEHHATESTSSPKATSTSPERGTKTTDDDGFETLKIGKYEKTPTIGTTPAKRTKTDPDDTSRLSLNANIDNDVLAVFPSIPTEMLPKKPSPPIEQLFMLTQLLADHNIAAQEAQAAKNFLIKAFQAGQSQYDDEFNAALEDVMTATSHQLVADRKSRSVSKKVVIDDIADHDMIEDAFYVAKKTFGEKLANEYRKRLLVADEDMEDDDAMKIVAACAYTDEIVEDVISKAEKRFAMLINKYDDDIRGKNETVRNEFDDLRARSNEPQKRDMTVPGDKHYNAQGDAYDRHILADGNGVFHAKLNDVEKAVVNGELARNATVAWYRNGTTKTTQSLCIAYQDDEGDWQRMFPDFVFFSSTDDGIKPSLIDPHSVHLADALPKLKGFARYAERYGDRFKRIEAVDKVNGKMRKLDLTNKSVRQAILEYDGTSAEALYLDDDIAKDYL